MADLKTKKTTASVVNFLNSLENEQRKKDCFTLVQIMQDVTGKPASLWGESIVGFGSYHYKYRSGREGDWFLTGFSPRKQNLSIYIMAGFTEYADLMKELGKYKTSSSCLYVKKMEDIDPEILKELILRSVNDMRLKYPESR